jgi:Fe2+ transport system protein FeoA
MYRSRDKLADVCPLSFIEPGREVRVVDIRAGRTLAGRLARMGIYLGSRIRVISNSISGPMIIGIGDKRIGLGRGKCNKIIVRRLD